MKFKKIISWALENYVILISLFMFVHTQQNLPGLAHSLLEIAQAAFVFLWFCDVVASLSDNFVQKMI